jgi:hypothetical protein
VAVLVGVTASVPLVIHRTQARPLSLAFERYGSILDFDYSVQDVAFLWFTNSSDKSYCLPMMGGTNTFQRETPIAYDSGSYMIR